MIIADHVLARILDVEIEAVRAIKALCRERHPRTGIALGMCACGCAGYGPKPPACQALERLFDVAGLVDLETKP